jgi:phytoene dehydrogenase-like protein
VASRSIAIVGGGFGGIGAAAMLRRAGYGDVTVFERGERIGGVWHHNTYPGAACDIPSHLYEFSFAPSPRWSRRYAPQARDPGLPRGRRAPARRRRPDRTDVTAARWDGARWHLQTSAGAHEADARSEAAEAFDRELRAALAGTVWHTGCANWYVDENGNDPNNWPWLWRTYRRRTERLDRGDYVLS